MPIIFVILYSHIFLTFFWNCFQHPLSFTKHWPGERKCSLGRFSKKKCRSNMFREKRSFYYKSFLLIYYRNVLVRHDYVKIRSQRLMGFSISIFVKRKHLLHVRDVEAQYTRLSVMESVSFNPSLEKSGFYLNCSNIFHLTVQNIRFCLVFNSAYLSLLFESEWDLKK